MPDSLMLAQPDKLEVYGAAAVTVEQGFLLDTAAYARRKGGKFSVLLTHDQRGRLERHGLVTYENIRWQGSYAGALPKGFRDPQLKEMCASDWLNAENQWFDVESLLAFVRRAEKPDGSYAAVMLIALLELCTNGGKKPKS